MSNTEPRTKSPYLLVVVIVGVLLGLVVASLLNTRLMGMSFLEVVVVVAVVSGVVLAVYAKLLRPRSSR